MKKALKKIPIYNQNPEAVGGIFIVQHTVMDLLNRAEKLEAHRDDFFIFFVLTNGEAIMKCDMIDVKMKAHSIMIVKPFQIHSAQNVSVDAGGYYIAVAPFLIPQTCFDIFQNLKISEQLNSIDPTQETELFDTVSLLHRSFTNLNSNKAQIINGLFNALVYRFSDLYSASQNTVTEHKNQSAVIYANLKKLLSEHSFLETPSYFSKKLNISTSHLNDCVKNVTGKSVTYWLQNAMITEAQRLLYYTESEVKQIAFILGFEDHTYFSRLFKKITGETPLVFRKKFRE